MRPFQVQPYEPAARDLSLQIRRMTVDPSEIGPGDRVRHGKWGLGTVREVVGEGDKAEAEVMFDTQGKKRLLLAWAPLERA